MKGQFTVIRSGITSLILFFFLSGFSQTSTKAPVSNSNDIYNIWYEWPHEATGNNTVYKTQKYTPVPGIDKQEAPLSKLVINSDGSFTSTQYCGYCPNYTITEFNGTFSLNIANTIVTGIRISLENEENNIVCDVISSTTDKLIINLPPSIKRK